MQTVTPRHLVRQRAVRSRNKSRAVTDQNVVEDKETLIEGTYTARRKAIHTTVHQTGLRSYAISEPTHGLTGSGKGIGVPSHFRTKVFIGKAAVPQDGGSEDAITGVAGNCLCDGLAYLMQ